jgi:hypothetical protein
LERLGFLLIKFSVLGEWTSAVEVARTIVASTSSASVAVRLQLQGNAMVTLCLAGFADEANRVAIENFHEAEATGLHRYSLRAALYLADTFMHIGDDEQRQHWESKIQALIDESPIFKDDIVTISFGLSQACTIGEPEKARALFERAERLGTFAGSPLRTRYRLFFYIWVELVSGTVVPLTSEIDRLVRNVREPVGVAYARELECAIACSALIAIGRSSEAKKLLSEFSVSNGNGRRFRPRNLREVEAILTLT